MIRDWIAVLLISQPYGCFAETVHAPIGGDLIWADTPGVSAFITDVKKLRSFGDPVAVLTKPSVKDETVSVIAGVGLTEVTLQEMVDMSFAKHFGAVPRSDVSKMWGPREDVGMFGCEVKVVARPLQSAFEVGLS